jgi:thymidylate synthase, flavin-dependent
MKVIKSSYEILTDLSDPISTMLKPIERAGRVCYKSENNITDESCITFCKNILSRGHEAVIEHSQLSVKFICDRAIANELVRHRLASYCQESTRYCNYSKDKFGNEIKVIMPEDLMPVITPKYEIWLNSCKQSEKAYFDLISEGVRPEIARDVLPLSTATEIIMTANVREWRSVLKLRTSARAHPQMRSLMRALLDELKSKVPVLFDDITYDNDK